MNKIVAFCILLVCASDISAQGIGSSQKSNWHIDIDAYDGDNLHLRGITKSALRNYKEALNYYNKYLKSAPSNAPAHFNRGIVEMRLQKYSLAVEDFDLAIQLNPAMYQSYYNRGFAKFKLGDTASALRDCNKAIAMHPCDTTYRSLGVLRAWMRNFSLSIEAFTKAIELNNAYVDAYVRRARVEGQIKKYDAAKRDFARAIELDSNYAEACIERANMKEDINELVSAIADCNKAIQIEPGNPQAFINRGWEKERLRQSDSAIADFDEAMRLAPGFSLAYSCRCAAKESLKDLKGALRDCDKAVKLDTASYIAYGNRSNVKHRLYDWKGSKEDYDKYMQLIPKDMLTHERDSSKRVIRNDTCKEFPNPPFLPSWTQPENVSHIKNDLELQNLKGHVKEVREIPPIDTSEKILRPWNLNILWRFNQQGYTALQAYYNDSIFSVISKDSTMKFNDRGQRIEYTFTDIETHTILQYRCRFIYDDNGRLKEKNESDLNYGIKQRTHYDDNGNETGGEVINPDSSLQSRWVVNYSYNKKGQKTQMVRIQIAKEGTDSTVYNYTFDGNGNTTEEEVECYGGVKRLSYKVKLDKQNRSVEDITYSPVSPEIEFDIRRKYDKYNNRIEEDYYKPNGKLATKTRMVYEYDSIGNWIKQTIYDNGDVRVIKRIIEYY